MSAVIDRQLLEAIQTSVATIATEVVASHEKLSVLSQDVTGLRQEVATLRQDVIAVQRDATTLRQDVTTMRVEIMARVDRLQDRMVGLHEETMVAPGASEHAARIARSARDEANST